MKERADGGTAPPLSAPPAFVAQKAKRLAFRPLRGPLLTSTRGEIGGFGGGGAIFADKRDRALEGTTGSRIHIVFVAVRRPS